MAVMARDATTGLQSCSKKLIVSRLGCIKIEVKDNFQGDRGALFDWIATEIYMPRFHYILY